MTENRFASDVAAASPEHVGSMVHRPGGITVIGVLILILAGLGLLGSGIGIASPILFKGFQQQIIDEAAKNPEKEDLQFQAKLQQNAMDLAEEYQVPGMVSNGVILLLCLGLFAGAIMLLSGSGKGRALLVTLLLIVVICDAGKAVLTYVIQKNQMATMNDGMSDMFDGQDMPEDAQKVAATVGKVASIATLVLTFGWFLLKAAFYIWSWAYLRKPDVVSWFQNKSAVPTGTA